MTCSEFIRSAVHQAVYHFDIRKEHSPPLQRIEIPVWNSSLQNWSPLECTKTGTMSVRSSMHHMHLLVFAHERSLTCWVFTSIVNVACERNLFQYIQSGKCNIDRTIFQHRNWARNCCRFYFPILLPVDFMWTQHSFFQPQMVNWFNKFHNKIRFDCFFSHSVAWRWRFNVENCSRNYF